MKTPSKGTATTVAAALATLYSASAQATAPCGDFGECKVLVEINSSDGDIGFHFLADGNELVAAALLSPSLERIFNYRVREELRDQRLTEAFAESAEPLCFDPATDDDPDNDGEEFVTLTDFLARWDAGTYYFFGLGENFVPNYGQTELTFNLPAAPVDLEWLEPVEAGGTEYAIAWAPGTDLGECSDGMDLLPVPPAEVPVQAWEVVLEPDVEGPVSAMTYVVRMPGDSAKLQVEVSASYLAALPPDTPAKIEIGAIGIDDNATFTEEGDICLNETAAGCAFDDE